MATDLPDSTLPPAGAAPSPNGAVLRQFPWSGSLRLAYWLYQVALHLGLPGLLLLLFLRARKEPLYKRNLPERFGFLRRARRPGGILVHAVSLGETRAAGRVVRSLLDSGETVILTHGSPAGLGAGRALFPDAISSGQLIHGYMPADLFWAVRLFLKRQNPRLGIVVEAELWPGLMAEAARIGLPMVQINGNYTERGFRRDKSIRGLKRGEFWKFYSRIITKSTERADRYLRAGVARDRVRVVGELKFDLEIEDAQKRAAEAFRKGLGGQPVLTIASSIADEEAELVGVIRTVRKAAGTPPRIVWVPRSPQRFDPVARRLRQNGLRVARRSAILNDRLTPCAGAGEWNVLVGDSIGEMDFYYTLGDIVFVGATLAPMGGHNIIEPLALERPVVTGPSLYGIAYPAREAMDAGALIARDTAGELAQLLVDLYSCPDRRAAFQARTRGFNQAHKGASDRTMQELAPYLENRP